MATNGQINTNTTYESYFWVRWSQKEQNISENYTIIQWSCGVKPGHQFGYNAVRMSTVTINGVQVYSGGTYSNILDYQERTFSSGELKIPHNADGTKTFTIAPFTGWLYANHNYSSNGGSFTLEPLARKAMITEAHDFTDVDNPSISFSNFGGFPIDVWLEPNPNGEHLCIRENIPNTGSYTWELTQAERDQLRNSCLGTSCLIRFGIYTHIGSTTESHFKNMVFRMTENANTKPSVTMEISPDNSLLPTSFDGLYVQGKTKINVSLSAEGKYGAGIQSYSAQVDGKTYYSDRFTSDAVQQQGIVNVIGNAKDTRGFVGSTEEIINVFAYSKPLVIPLGNENAIMCYRSDGNGKKVSNSTSLWVKAKRSYHSINGHNGCALRFRWKPALDFWNEIDHKWVDLISKTNTTSNEYDSLIPGVVFDLKTAYTLQFIAIDDIGEYDIKTFDIPTQDVALHLGKGGKNVSIGTYCDYSEERTFYSDWKAIFDKELVIGGFPLANFVIEEATDGNWTYRKWFDGSAECCGTIVQEDVPVLVPWGNLFRSDDYAIDLPSGLFSEKPQFNIMLSGTKSVMLAVRSDGTENQTPYLCAVSPWSESVDTLNTTIVAYGRWK